VPAFSPAPREPDPAEIERALKESGLELVQTRSAPQSILQWSRSRNSFQPSASADRLLRI